MTTRAHGLVAGLRRRPVLAAALVYAALTVLLLSPGLMPGKTLSNSDVLSFDPPFVTAKSPALTTPSNPELGDALTLQFFLHHTARELPRIPLWNPYIVGGRPFQANSQSAVFGLYSLPAYVLPFWTALGWIGVLKLWVAGFGTFLLGRALGMRWAGALMAGIVFALSLKMVTWISYPHMSVWTFIPWLLLLTDRLVRRPDLVTGAGLALVVGLQFLVGHAESSFHVLMTAAAFFAFRLWQTRRASDPAARPLLRPLLAFGGALAAGTALAAVSLLPFLELLLQSADLRDRGGDSIDLGLPLSEGIGLFLPDWWGRPTQTPIRLFLFERAFYVGALPLTLAVAALVLRRPRADRIAVAAWGLFWAAVVMSVPPFLQVVTRLPVFSSGHNSRLITLSMFSLALLAGWGLDDLSDAWRASRRRRQVVLGVAAALLVVPLIVGAAIQRPTLPALRQGLEVAWLFADPPGEFRNPIGVDVIRMSSLWIWGTFAALALALVALRVGRRLGPTPFVALGVLLVCADLFRAGMGFNPAIDSDFAEPPRTEAIRFLERQRPARFVATAEVPQNVLPFEFGLYEARGYDLPIVQRYDRLWRQEVAPQLKSVAAGLGSVALELPDVTAETVPALARLGVTHVLRAKSVRATPPARGLVPYPPLDAPGLTQVYDGPDARVYRVQGALPRAWVVGAQKVVPDEDAARRRFTDPAFDARRVAVTEERVAGLPEGATAARSGGGSARISDYEPERVEISARSRGPGLLVLGDTDFPGWKAKVNGRDADIERVDYVFRGVRIGPGESRVEFTYEPLSWTVGWITSVLTALGLALAVAIGLRRRRRRDAGPGPDGPEPPARAPEPAAAGAPPAAP